MNLAGLTLRLPVEERLIAVRLILWTTVSGIWDLDVDDDWFDALAQALQSLDVADQPARIETAQASLSAVGLMVLWTHSPPRERTPRVVIYDQTAERLQHLLPANDPELIASYSQHLQNSDGTSLDPDDVVIHAEMIVKNDPVADAVVDLQNLGWEAHRHGDLLVHVIGHFSNPRFAALQAITTAQDAPLVGVWAENQHGKWALTIWSRPDLFEIEHNKQGLLWRHLLLPLQVTPGVLALGMNTDPGAASQYLQHHGAFTKRFAEADAALDSLGISDPQPPEGCA